MHTLQSLMTFSDIETATPEAALDLIGHLVDLAGDAASDAGVERALKWSDFLAARSLSPDQEALLNYFRANAWGVRQALQHADPAAAWDWDQPALEQQVLCLRRALNGPGFEHLALERRCQILTNLANQFHTMGRFVEAQTYWSRALRLDPNFWMARGNRGGGRLTYARALYDRGHADVFVLLAQSDLAAAVELAARHPVLGHEAASESYHARATDLASRFDLVSIGATFNPDGHALGRSNDERRYRSWCLENQLYLNPLNDLGAHSIAARDVLTLPTFVTSLTDPSPPPLIGFYNQLKQEFVSARWLYYEGMLAGRPHFSDRNVLLYNTLDYPVYALGVEKTKLSYRSAYSIFDKVAYFLNGYMRLGVKPKQVSFRSIWRPKDGAPIRAELVASKNLPFRGLYWLSKDLFDDVFKDTIEPDAEALHDIRVRLEHRYLHVRESSLASRAGPKPSDADLVYPISRADLTAKTLRLLGLARAALVYLSLGMHREERRRAAVKDGGLSVSMSLDVWEDKWKQ